MARFIARRLLTESVKLGSRRVRVGEMYDRLISQPADQGLLPAFWLACALRKSLSASGELGLRFSAASRWGMASVILPWLSRARPRLRCASAKAGLRRVA